MDECWVKSQAALERETAVGRRRRILDLQSRHAERRRRVTPLPPLTMPAELNCAPAGIFSRVPRSARSAAWTVGGSIPAN